MKRVSYALVFSIIDPKIVEIFLELLLRGNAGFPQVTPLIRPILQPAIIEHLKFIADDEGHDVVAQAFLEQNQPTDTPVSVLKRMNPFKTNMKIKNVVQRFVWNRIVQIQQLLHLVRNILRRGSLFATDLIWQLLIAADSKPTLARVARTALQR